MHAELRHELFLPYERQDLIALVRQAGPKRAGLFCDADANGQYHLFDRERI